LDGCNDLAVTPVTPINACLVTNNTSDVLTIYDAPDGAYFGRFGIGESLYAVENQNGWYRVYVTPFSNYGWVQGVTAQGQCG
jgi:hypothetical protein